MNKKKWLIDEIILKWSKKSNNNENYFKKTKPEKMTKTSNNKTKQQQQRHLHMRVVLNLSEALVEVTTRMALAKLVLEVLVWENVLGTQKITRGFWGFIVAWFLRGE